MTYIYFINNNTGFVITYHYVIKTTNGGINWQANYITGSDGLTSIAFFNNNTGYLLGGGCNISYKTTNCGLNWEQICTTPPQYQAPIYRCSVKINDSLILIGGAQTQPPYQASATIYKATPSNINIGFYVGTSGTQISRIVMAGNSGIGYAWGNGYTKKTTEFGNTWYNTSNLHYTVSFYNDTLGLYISKRNSTNYCVFFYATNSGNIWISKDSLWNSEYFTFGRILDGRIVVAIGDSGKIVRNDNFLINVVNISGIVPKKYSLLQNYPNPFNPTTKIRFDLPKSTKAKLIIYDILGREVAILVNEKLNAGSNEISWHASAYPSGVYFYRLITKDFSQTRRMILIK